MNEDPDQDPEPVKTVFPGIIKPQVPGMPERRYLEKVADGYQRSTIVGVGFVPVDAVFVRPDGVEIHGVKVRKVVKAIKD
jgi:hypothetical protein